MKIAITGHSRGIGAGVAGALRGHEIIGFSRSNGYDISKFASQRKIIKESLDADVFVNNAWIGFHQVEMFDRIYDEWKFESGKTIVNINSRARYGRMDVPNIYRTSKKELAKHADCSRMWDKKCRIININPGYVYTEMVENHQLSHALTVEECANIIAWAVQQPHHIEIGELSFWTICDK